MIGRKYTHGRNEDELGEIEIHRIAPKDNVIIYQRRYRKMLHTWPKTSCCFPLDTLKVFQLLNFHPVIRQASSNIAHSIQAILELPYDDIPIVLVQIVRSFIVLHCTAPMIAVWLWDQSFELDRIV